MNTTFINWIAAAGIAAVLSGAYVILDGPSEAELAKAQAADLADAKAQANAARAAYETRKLADA